ncbi:MAG TPA: hypothetical protein VG013_17115 [Gemmataceae bacterium]|jgi:hypothetical protein|nr:hypothetical protein [Gemmataceae bacterium]
MMAHADAALNPQALGCIAGQLQAFVQQAADQGLPTYEAEHGIGTRILAIGRPACSETLHAH